MLALGQENAHCVTINETQQKSINYGAKQIVQNIEDFDTKTCLAAAIGTLIEQELLGAAYAILKEVHIIDVHMLKEAKGRSKTKQQESRKIFEIHVDLKMPLLSHSHFIYGHDLVQSKAICIFEMPFSVGKYLQSSKGGKDAALQLQKAAREERTRG